MLVHGAGVAVHVLANDRRQLTRRGAIGSSPATSMYWEYDKDDFSLRLDVETGPLTEILLDATLGADPLGSYAGASARLSGAQRPQLRGQRSPQRSECPPQRGQRAPAARRLGLSAARPALTQRRRPRGPSAGPPCAGLDEDLVLAGIFVGRHVAPVLEREVRVDAQDLLARDSLASFIAAQVGIARGQQAVRFRLVTHLVQRAVSPPGSRQDRK